MITTPPPPVETYRDARPVLCRHGVKIHRHAGHHTGCGRDIDRDATPAEVLNGERCRQCYRLFLVP